MIRAVHLLWLAGLAALLAIPAAGASARDLIRAGNEHYAAGRYEEALQAYQRAEAAGAAGAELLHDQAAAQFKLGRRAEARELWVKALALKDAAFEARARYNLGNCDYAEALSAGEAQDGQAVREHLQRAIEQYRDALRLDPGLTDARANLELAYQLRQQLEEQSTSQPQSQPSPQSSTRPNEQQEQSSQPSQEQGDSGQQQEQSEQSSSTQPSTQPEQPQSEQQENQPATQPATSQPSTQPDTEPPGQEQQEQQAQPQPAETQPERPAEPRSAFQLTPEQAQRLLQKIRDAEKARRKLLREREAARHKPVDRDW